MTPPPPIDSSRRDEFAGGPRAAVATTVRRGEENKVSGCLKKGGSGDQIAKRRSPTCSPTSEKSDWSWPSPSDHRRRSHAPPLRVGVRQAAGRVHPAFGAPCCIGSHLAGAPVLLCTAPHWILPVGTPAPYLTGSAPAGAPSLLCTCPNRIVGALDQL
ncbi:hypothetical protein GQ457_10G009090 [Hibiscus cannabinus]